MSNQEPSPAGTAYYFAAVSLVGLMALYIALRMIILCIDFLSRSDPGWIISMWEYGDWSKLTNKNGPLNIPKLVWLWDVHPGTTVLTFCHLGILGWDASKHLFPFVPPLSLSLSCLLVCLPCFLPASASFSELGARQLFALLPLSVLSVSSFFRPYCSFLCPFPSFSVLPVLGFLLLFPFFSWSLFVLLCCRYLSGSFRFKCLLLPASPSLILLFWRPSFSFRVLVPCRP